MLLGDMIAKVTQMVGIAPCTPCQQRQAALNAWHAQMTGQQLPPRPLGSFVLEVRDGQVISRR